MNETTASTAPCLIGEFDQVTEIAVPIGGMERYERSLAVAAILAARWGVPVRIMHVRSEGDVVGNDRLEQIRAAFEHQHPEVMVGSTLVAGEDVAESVEAVTPPTALVVMSSDQVDRRPTGSTAERILRAVGAALIIGPDADSEHVFGPVNVALDGSPTAERAIDAACSFARSLDQRLELVQVVDGATSAHVARLRHAGEQVSESGYLQGVVRRLADAGQPAGWEVVHADDPVEGVLAAVHRRGGGPIVVGSHGASGLPRRMLGSTAMGLVAANTHPVLVVTTRAPDEAELTP